MKLLRRMSAFIVFALLALPMTASATLMEFGWRAKWGEGVIVYDNSVIDSEPAQNHWFFRNSIVSYDVLAWQMMTPYRFQGEGGSIGLTAFPPQGQCPTALDQPCRTSSLSFYLGMPPSDGSPRYRVDVDAALPIGHDGWLLEIASAALGDFTPDGGAVVANDQNGITYPTMDITNRIWNVPAQVIAVPAPATGLLALLGVAGIAAGRRKRRAMSA